MSLYGDYIKEREGFGIVEDERGFATYEANPDFWYIIDIYVKPEHRKSKLASTYADVIAAMAHNQGVKLLRGSVDPTTSGATDSVKVLLAYGFKIIGIEGPLIWFEKGI